MRKQLLQSYLDSRRTPVSELDGAQRLHEMLKSENQKLYLSILSDKSAHISHRAAAFANLVADCNIQADEVVTQLNSATGNEVLDLIELFRIYRINGRRARQVGLRMLLGRTDLPELAAASRNRLRRMLKHLIGERTWSAVVRAMAGTIYGDDSQVSSLEVKALKQFLERTVLRFAVNRDEVLEVLQFLAGFGFPHPQQLEKPKTNRWLVIPWLEANAKPDAKEVEVKFGFSPTNKALLKSLKSRIDLTEGIGLPRATLSGIRGTFFPETPFKVVREMTPNAMSKSVVNEGDLTALLKQIIAGKAGADVLNVSQQLSIASEISVDAKVALVLDLSASMASSGSRKNHPAALGQAIVREVERAVTETQVIRVGGSSIDTVDGAEASASKTIAGPDVVRPSGQADLAMAVLNAAKANPDVIFVITDGYDNARQGDVATVVEGMRALQISIPVLQVVPLFTIAEDVSERRLGGNVPLVGVDNDRATGELIARAQLASLPDVIDEESVETFCRLALGVQG